MIHHRIDALRYGFVLLALAATPAFAAKHTFDPGFGASASYINNVLFTDEPDDQRDDSSLRVTLHLPYQMETKESLLSIRYDTTFENFQRFTDLDFFTHKLTARWASTRSARSELRIYGSFALTEDENFVTGFDPDPDAPDEVDPFLIRRSRRWGGTVRVLHTTELSRRWDFATSVTGSFSTVEPIDELPADSTDDLEDKTSGGVTFRASHTLSERTRLGGSYGFHAVEQEISGDERLHTLRANLFQDLSRRVSLRVEAGGFRRTRDSTPDSDGSFDSSGFSGSVNIVFNEDLLVGPFLLDFELSARPSTSGNLAGSATNNTAAIMMTDPRTRTWNWSLYSRFVNRVPFDREFPVYNTFSTGFNVRKEIGKKFRIRGQLEYVNQQSSDTDESTGEFFRASAGLVWNPLAGTRIAQN